MFDGGKTHARFSTSVGACCLPSSFSPGPGDVLGVPGASADIVTNCCSSRGGRAIMEILEGCRGSEELCAMSLQFRVPRDALLLFALAVLEAVRAYGDK